MDILKFLIIIAIIAIPIIKEARKNKAKEAGNPSPLPKAKETNPAKIFLPGERDTTIAANPAKKSKKAKTLYADTIQASPEVKKTTSEPRPSAADRDREIAIRSAEDARKAIIWSEILKRKY